MIGDKICGLGECFADEQLVVRFDINPCSLCFHSLNARVVCTIFSLEENSQIFSIF